MAASDRDTRRTDEVERARHIAASEAAAFATTAGTMLLGLLAGAEAAHDRNVQLPPAATHPPVPSSQPTEAAPTEPAPADHPPVLDDRHAGEIEAPAPDPMAINADTTETIQAPHLTALIDAPAGGQAATAQVSISSIQVSTFSDPAHHTPLPAGSSGATAPPSADPEALVHHITDSVSGLVDTSLATVTHTIENLSTAVEQLTTSLTSTVSELVGGLTGLVTNLTHDAPATGAAEPSLADLLGPTPAAAESSDTAHHGPSMLDTAGAVPMTLLSPLPLHLGFLGQPTTGGHETHDGAFSALGVHHF
jgi:hypothetical protein